MCPLSLPEESQEQSTESGNRINPYYMRGEDPKPTICYKKSIRKKVEKGDEPNTVSNDGSFWGLVVANLKLFLVPLSIRIRSSCLILPLGYEHCQAFLFVMTNILRLNLMNVGPFP
jgi:hypothetical protein